MSAQVSLKAADHAEGSRRGRREKGDGAFPIRRRVPATPRDEWTGEAEESEVPLAVSSCIERRRRCLFHPWESLSIEERREALTEARRSGACAAGALYWGLAESAGPASLPPAAPGHYGALAPLLGPEGGERWRRTPAARLATDPRVCAFCEGWERARRALLGLEPIDEGREARRHAVWQAQARHELALAEYERARRVLSATDRSPVGSRERLTVGRAHLALFRSRQEHGCAILLYRAADPAGPAVTRPGEDEPFPRFVW